jgi:transcriptional regulator with XRE-family HTH domain
MTNRLGPYLKDRRGKLDPATLGFAAGRRRTPGLRREEVAARANVSTTWYTWLEQGRGGAPSAEVLERIAKALMLTDAEREHLFLIGLGRTPDVRYRPVEGITPRLQRILDAFTVSPAIVRTLTWDVVAWNRAAAAVLTDYSTLEAHQRNILRMMFGRGQVREAQFDWQSVARFVVAAFRADVARAGAEDHVRTLIDELSRSSPEFAAMWRENDVQTHGDGVKRLRHPALGELQLEYSAFGVDGRPDLTMIVYNPASDETAAKVRALIRQLK